VNIGDGERHRAAGRDRQLPALDLRDVLPDGIYPGDGQAAAQQQRRDLRLVAERDPVGGDGEHRGCAAGEQHNQALLARTTLRRQPQSAHAGGDARLVWHGMTAAGDYHLPHASGVRAQEGVGHRLRSFTRGHDVHGTVGRSGMMSQGTREEHLRIAGAERGLEHRAKIGAQPREQGRVRGRVVQ
jgi:hypothetical protein